MNTAIVFDLSSRRIVSVALFSCDPSNISMVFDSGIQDVSVVNTDLQIEVGNDSNPFYFRDGVVTTE